MQIDKDQIIQFLQERGQNSEADQAQQNLPQQVDTDQHAGLLAQHGLPVEDLLGKFGGGGLGNLL